MLAAPIFDLWMDSRPTKEVLCGSMVFLIVGSGLYTLYPVEIAAILLSRLMIGIAAGKNKKEKKRKEKKIMENHSCNFFSPFLSPLLLLFS